MRSSEHGNQRFKKILEHLGQGSLICNTRLNWQPTKSKVQ